MKVLAGYDEEELEDALEQTEEYMLKLKEKITLSELPYKQPKRRSRLRENGRTGSQSL